MQKLSQSAIIVESTFYIRQIDNLAATFTVNKTLKRDKNFNDPRTTQQRAELHTIPIVRATPRHRAS